MRISKKIKFNAATCGILTCIFGKSSHLLLIAIFLILGCNKENTKGPKHVQPVPTAVLAPKPEPTPEPEPVVNDNRSPACSVFNSNPGTGPDTDFGFGSDPLSGQQWYLNNTEQKAFARDSGTLGVDINWLGNGKTGNGVIVAIIDSGLDIVHEDLRGNVVNGGSWDFSCADSNPTSLKVSGDHGTAVAGIIAARGGNGVGITGVAGRALLKAFNVLADNNRTTSNYLASLGGSDNAPKSSDVSVFNQSYGLSTVHHVVTSKTVFKLLEKQYEYGVSKLRGGKGAIYVKSTGNGFIAYNANGVPALCREANKLGVSCQNTNMDPTNTLPYNIIVGAVNADGIKASYSATGSSLWISAPGGEHGLNNPDKIPDSVRGDIPESYYKPAILTTDQTGCVNGYSPSLPYNYFEKGSADNPDCNYASTFNGTSAATPIVSGVVALLLETNPNLTWRDVKHILAITARQIDKESAAIKLRGYEAKQGWVTNKAGYKFHNYYGFGLVDTYKAINKAKNYSTDLGEFKVGGWVASKIAKDKGKIPDANSKGVSSIINYPSITVADGIMKGITVVETVQVMITISHINIGELGIELYSPSGTKSILLPAFNGFTGDKNLRGTLFASNAFYGENAVGNWTLRVIDMHSERVGRLGYWKIRIYGH